MRSRFRRRKQPVLLLLCDDLWFPPEKVLTARAVKSCDTDAVDGKMYKILSCVPFFECRSDHQHVLFGFFSFLLAIFTIKESYSLLNLH